VELRGAFDAAMDCASCRVAPRAFELARAPWRYAGSVQTAVRRFKYRRRWRLGHWLADGMAQTAREALPLEDVSAVVPVPLHWLKRRLGGCNPAEDLARPLARALGKPCLPRALVRTRWTTTQTRLSWHERTRNVREAFTAFPGDVRSRTVLLVDDVLTSGATANACALALKQAGARAVFVLTAARTPLE
jgi:ComF family protein